MDELKKEFHQNIDVITTPQLFCKEEYKKLAKIDDILMLCGNNYCTFTAKDTEIRENMTYQNFRNTNVAILECNDIENNIISIDI